MGFPSKLKDFDLYINGTDHAGVIPELTIPKLALKSEEFHAGGMVAPLDITLGLQKIEFDFTLGGLIESIFGDFGAAAHDATLLRFAGAYQEDGSGTVRAAEVIALGKVSEVDFGSQKKASDTAHKSKMTCTYYELNVDGLNWVTIDVMNQVFIVMGIDRYAEIRAALGR